MARGKSLICALVSGALVSTAALGGIPMTAEAAPEIVAGNYEIDMERIPQVHFAKHKDWETLYRTAWESHKSNIKPITKGLNPELTTDEVQSYYVDEAFDQKIYQWDTLFMMMFDKYGLHEFPTLNSMDNFYYHQFDTQDESDGYICRMIFEEDGRLRYDYTNVDAINPPMFGWAEWEQYKVHGDVSRFTKRIKGKPIIDRLASYFQFIKRTRTHKSGPAAGLYVSNGQSSGLDNTPNQDWYGWGQAANDMSLQQVQAAEYIRMIAEEILDKDESLTEDEREKYQQMKELYAQEAEDLKALIQQKLWSQEGGFFFHMDKNTGKTTDIATPTGLWALAAGVATKEQADRMIQDYALNSNKMFRPNGLATVCYDYPTFKSTGGYWNGAMWSPASFQWLKGLQKYGYDDLAFEEAVRHINGLADVCVKGAYDRYGSFLHTLWENYSTEYSIPGSTEFSDTQPARANFVGWAGALGIGSVIEDIVGITVDGRENVVEWNIKLTEAFGIDNLYFHGEQGENFVSLSCEERLSDSAGAKIHVEADRDFELRVKVGGKTTVLQVEAGQNSYEIEGTDKEAASLGIKTTLRTDAAFSKDKVEAAKSAVTFGTQGASEREDGLPNQIETGSRQIFNVNTVGYYRTNAQYPTTLQDSALMQAYGNIGAKEYRKATSPYGAEGFMFMTPASNTMQTVKALIGVKNGTAVVEADLMDASETTKTASLSGGEEETVYVVEIPNRASKDTRLMVTVTMEQKGEEAGEISLKGILLEDGGNEVMEAPKDVSAASRENGLCIDALAPESISYDSYHIYYRKENDKEWKMKETVSLPYVIGELENYERYQVFVTGVKNGTESLDSRIVSQIPEKSEKTDAQRAYADWMEIQEKILHGNRDFSHVMQALDFSAAGGTYHTKFAFESDSAELPFGLREDGTVANPIWPQKDMETILKVTATCGERQIRITVPVTLLAVKEEGSTGQDLQVLSGWQTPSGEVDLTAEGCADWNLFTSSDLEQIERKVNGKGIANLSAIQEVTKVNEDSCDTMFRYGDGMEHETGVYDKSVVFEQVGNGVEFDLPYAKSRQKAKIYLGAWSAKVKMTVSVVKDGQAVQEYEEVFDTGRQASEDPAIYQVLSVSYQLEDANAILHVKICNEELYDTRWGNFNLTAVTLHRNFSVQAEEAEHGKIIVTNPIAEAGTPVTVFAVPDSGYHLESMRYYETGSETGLLIQEDAFCMPSGNVRVRAVFVPDKADPKPPVQPIQPDKPPVRDLIEEGKTYEKNGYRYKVTSVSKKTVEVVGRKNKKASKISVPDNVQLGEKAYQVTAIGKNAFAKNKKATQAVIGKYVKTIGANAFAYCTKLKKVAIKSTKLKQIQSKAFYKCKKLKSIIIKSKVLKSVGKQAWKGIYKKAVIKVPAARYKKYVKLLANKGQGVKVKK